MRFLLIPALLLAAAGCDEGSATSGGGGAAPVREKPEPPVPATTGISVIQRDHDALRAEVAELEKALESGEQLSAPLVRQQLQLGRNLLQAARMAAREEAKAAHRHRYTQMRKQLGEMEQARGELYANMREITGFLEGERRGTGGIPPGFTEEELRDKLGELQEQARALEKRQEELRTEMAAAEERLQEDDPPPQDDIYTQEAKALEETCARLEKVLQGLGE